MTADGILTPADNVTIFGVAQEAAAIATTQNRYVQFTFNDVTVRVGPEVNVVLMLRDWLRAASGYLGVHPVVGPVFRPVLSEAERARDEQVENARRGGHSG